jgi:CheY-like chemotaxis protein
MTPQQTILLVEDDEVDAKSVRRALRDLNAANPLAHVWNGEDALAWLRDLANAAPGLILLDLNLPLMNGIEFLRGVKSDERLRRIPVVVLTTSKLEHDRIASFNHSVAGYIIKPVDYQEFVEVIRTIQLYWTLSQSA